MILGLSSAAAPDLPIRELVEVCRRRGLAALELVAGHGHGLAADADEETIRNALRLTTLRDVKIAAVFPGDHGTLALDQANRLAQRLGAPLLVRAAELSTVDLECLLAGARSRELLLLHGTDPSHAGRLATLLATHPAPRTKLAWEIDPSTDDPDDVPRVLEIVVRHLALLRLRGGGPESATQTGFGVGSLMSSLAIARYAGPLILTPTTPRHHLAWSAWLGRRGGWGCGSKQSDQTLVPLPIGQTTSTSTG